MLAMGCGRSLRRAVWAGGEMHACALFGQPRPLPSLERILSSHPLLHAAEGQLSRDAVAAAAEMEGLRVAHIAPEQAAEWRLRRQSPPSAVRLGRYCQRSSAAIWIRLPQVSFTMAMVEPVTLVGGMVNSAPAAFIRSYSRCTSST